MQIELISSETVIRLGVFMIIRGYIICDLFVALIQNNLCRVSFVFYRLHDKKRCRDGSLRELQETEFE